MESTQNTHDDSFHQNLAELAWQIELGADEAISETPIDRYSLTDVVEKPAKKAEQPAPEAKSSTPPTHAIAQTCDTLESLKTAIENPGS